MSINAVSLFAGVGGIDLALHNAGIPTVAAAEIDNAARGVLAHRFPNTTLHTDVTKVEPDDLLTAGFVPRDGILTGGFPCQDLSVAGARAGLAGARSGLFWHIIRLAEALQPRWILLENVPGLLSSNGGRDMGTVIGALVECGYGIAWRVLDAQHFGVPQRRRRVVIVGCLGDDGSTSSSVLAFTESGRRDPAPRRTPGQEVAGTLGGGSGNRGWAPDTDRMTFVPFVKAKRAQTIDDDETWTVARVSPTLNAFDVGDTRATTLAAHRQTAFGQPPAILNPAEQPPLNVRRLTPTECERLQGFPDGWTAQRLDPKKGVIDQADAPRYKQMGNAVAVPVFEWVAKRIVTAHQELK